MDQDLVEDFEQLQLQDDDWNELHRKIVEERNREGLTISEFLDRCGLDVNRLYFKQLCCKTPKKLPPSRRRNSPGREFRDAVAKYFAGQAVPTNSSPQSLEIVLSEWCLDNRPLLRESHISHLRLGGSSLTEVVVYAYRQCTLSDQDVLDMLMRDEKIKNILAGTDLTMSRCESQLLARVSCFEQ